MVVSFAMVAAAPIGAQAPADAGTLTVVKAIGVDAGIDRSDLDQFWPPLLENVRVVGLGEANHGTSEFFRFKHRMIEYLVERHGFRTVALESGFFSCEKLDAYIAGENIDLVDALDDQQYTIWVTQEMVELVNWMRRFNRGRPANDRLEIVGFDARDNGRARDRVRAFLAQHDPRGAPDVESILDDVTLTGFGPRDAALAHADVLDQLLARWVAHEFDLRHRAGDDRYAEALQALRVLRQAVAYAALGNPSLASDGRDYAMAENLGWRLNQDPKAKIVVWAHNGHIGVGSNGVPNGRSAGSWLRERLGDRYLALGFTFGEGTFRAYGERDGSSGYFPFPSGPAPDGFVGDLFGRLSRGPLMVDLRTARARDALPAFLRRLLGVRYADGGVHTGYRSEWQSSPLLLDVAREFDVIVHVPTITACSEIDT